MPSSNEGTLAERLAKRIRTRTHPSGEVSFYLELRGIEWGDKGQLTIRFPGHPDWPKKGVAVNSIEEAEEQLEHYADWLEKEKSGMSSRRAAVVTWAKAIPAYLDALEAEKGTDHGTFKAHRSALMNYVLPRWGGEPLTLQTKAVGDWLSKVTVTKKRGDRYVQERAAANTMRVAYAAMRACWRHHFGGHSTPSFNGIRIRSDDDSVQRKADAREGRIRLSPTQGFGAQTVYEILVQAAIDDYMGIRSLPKVWPRSVPNTPEVIAWQIGTMTRITELMHIRWHGWQDSEQVPMVDLERAGGVLYVPGTKSGNAPRWVVIWDALRPWILRMRHVSLSPAESTGFVFATPTSGSAPPSEGTYAGRVDKAITGAGAKRKGTRTHILRNTGSTWVGTRLAANLLKTLMGHSSAHGGATDFYLDPHLLVLEMPAGFRTYMDGLLPSPEDVYGEASKRLRRRGHDVDLLAIERDRYL